MSHHTKDSVRDRIVRTWLRGSRILTLFSRRLSDKIKRPYIEKDVNTTELKPETSWPSGSRRDKDPEKPADAEFADRSRKKHQRAQPDIAIGLLETYVDEELVRQRQDLA